MADFSTNINSNDVYAVQLKNVYEKGKTEKSSYQSRSDYAVAFFENATWESLESGKLPGLTQKEFDLLYSMTSGMKENPDSQIKRIGVEEQKLLNNLKKYPKNNEYLSQDLAVAQEKYDKALKKSGADSTQTKDAKKELEIIKENIISGKTVEEGRFAYY